MEKKFQKFKGVRLDDPAGNTIGFILLTHTLGNWIFNSCFTPLD